MTTSTTSPGDIAPWMRDKVLEESELYQSDVAEDISRTFGSEFVYQNDNGNLAISKAVLKEFRKLTSEDVVWERRWRYWRLRDSRDTPGRRQAD